jgi:hypothetical protein
MNHLRDFLSWGSIARKLVFGKLRNGVLVTVGCQGRMGLVVGEFAPVAVDVGLLETVEEILRVDLGDVSMFWCNKTSYKIESGGDNC